MKRERRRRRRRERRFDPGENGTERWRWRGLRMVKLQRGCD